MFIITGFVLPIVLFVISLVLKAGMLSAQKVLDDGGGSSSNTDSDEINSIKQLAIATAKRVVKAVKTAILFIKSIIVVLEVLTVVAIIALIMIVVLLVAALVSILTSITGNSANGTTLSGSGSSSSGFSSGIGHDAYDKWFWVGDSRTVGLAISALGMNYTGGTSDTIINDSVAARVNMGYAWWASTEMTSTREKVESLSGYNIVFNFGVNDLAIDSYVTYYTGLPDSFYQNNNVIFMSVNPVCLSKGSSNTTNAMAFQFNDALKSAVEAKGGIWVDTFTDVFHAGGSDDSVDATMFADALHYTSDTYKAIYNYTVDKIKGSSGSSEEPTTESVTTTN